MSQDRSALGILGTSSMPYACLGESPRWQDSRWQDRTGAHSNLLFLDQQSSTSSKEFWTSAVTGMCIGGGNLQIGTNYLLTIAQIFAQTIWQKKTVDTPKWRNWVVFYSYQMTRSLRRLNSRHVARISSRRGQTGVSSRYPQPKTENSSKLDHYFWLWANLFFVFLF